MTSTPVTLEELLVYVERAARGDRRLLVALFKQLQRLARHPTAPPEDRLLGEILGRVLMGDRSPNLGALPAELRAEVQAMLDRLACDKE
jgi:hypothetical protein